MNQDLRWLILKQLKFLKLYSTARSLWMFYDKYSITRHKRKLSFFSRFIKSGDLCFDVGACFGDVTKIFLDLGATVVSIEPQKFCLDQLYKQFGRNKNVIIVPQGMSNKEGYAQLSICEDEPAIATMSNKWKSQSRFSEYFKWSRFEQVKVTTLDHLISKYGLPKFCKIDVEGFEKQVLKGLTKQIPFLSFEFTEELLTDAEYCMDYLASLGKVKFNLVIGGAWNFLFQNWQTKIKLHQKLESLDLKYLHGDIYAKFI